MQPETIPAFNPVKFMFSEEEMGKSELLKAVYTQYLKQVDEKEIGHA